MLVRVQPDLVQFLSLSWDKSSSTPKEYPMDCMVCGGPMILIGVLGSRRWYRCRDCGIDDHEEVEENENNAKEW